ncbi:MAG: hypothetical protein WAP23_03330 [Candidatus Spechtbacterales bacterium]
MAIPKENVIDLRKPNREKVAEAPAPKPRDKKKGDIKYEFDNSQIKPWVKITAIVISGVALASLVAYFLMSKNYLASLLFALAGITLGISILFNKKRGVETPRKTKHNGTESLMDIFTKILGL